MHVDLFIHLEQVSPTSAVWWGESPDVPGFSVTAESMAELFTLAEKALRDILNEQGDDLVGITSDLVTDEPDSENPAVTHQEDQTDTAARVVRVSSQLSRAAA